MPITTGYCQTGNVFDAGTVTITWTDSTVWANATGDGTNVITACDHWPTWVEETVTGATATTWTNWITVGDNAIYLQPTQAVYQEYQPTPAQLEELRVAEARAREVYQERDRQAKAANDRARDLLHSLLTKAQRESLEKRKHFEVVGQSGKRYRIHHGSHGNVRLLDGEKEVAKFCGQPNDVPVADMMLAQKLQLEADEDEFLRRANRTAA